MWAWIKRYWSTDTQSVTTDPIQAAYIEQNRSLVALLERQQQTLDRIVTAKYDRPIAAPVEVTPNEPMPSSMLYDVLSSESDAEFLEKSEHLN